MVAVGDRAGAGGGRSTRGAPSHAPGHRRRRPPSGLRDARRHAAADSSGPTRHRLQRAPFRLSHRHPRQRVVFRDRRVSGSAWADGQHHLRSARKRDQGPRYREAREPGRCRACRGTAAHVANPQRAASSRGQVAARREQRVERRDVSAEPHARDRRHHPLRVQPPLRARGGCRSGPRTCAGCRHAERRPESVCRRRLPQS